MKRKLLSLLLTLSLIIGMFCNAPVKADAAKTLEDYYTLVNEIESSEEPLPAKFDLRDYGFVTSVKDQGNYGTCYSFAIVAALESNALLKGFGEYDLSERYLAWCAKHVLETDNIGITGEGISSSRSDWYSNGFPEVAAYSLMNGYGIGLESDYPYKYITKSIPQEDMYKEVLKCKSVSWVERMDIDAIKRNVIKYGASTMSIPWTEDKKVFNLDNFSVYMSQDYAKAHNTQSGHVMAIVGWDDNYGKENFSTEPEKDGAWIVKNSWGEEYAYFYISYYTYIRPQFDSYVYSFELEPLQTYDSLYAYDGGVGETEVADISDIAMAFKANAYESLTGIALKVKDDVQAMVKIYKDTDTVGNIDESKCIYTEIVNLTGKSYQTINFAKGVNVSADESVLVTVHFNKPVTYYVDGKWKLSDMTNNYSANPGETFIKENNGSWKDLVDAGKVSACIKVFSREGYNHRALTLGGTEVTLKNTKEATIDLSWKVVDGANSYEIYRKAAEESFSLIKTVEGTVLKYVDTKLTLGKKYTYMVIPVGDGGEGFSNEVTGTATIAATWIKKLDTSKKGQITITVNKTKSAKSYSIYKVVNGAYKWIGNTASGTFIDKDVKSGASYTYKVRANKGSIVSAFSAPKTAKAK